MLLSALERNRPKLQIKRRMLRRVHDAIKLEQLRLQQLRPPQVGLYFHRNYMSSSCNSVDNLDFVSINGIASPAPYKGRGASCTSTSDPTHSIKRISSSSSSSSNNSPTPSQHRSSVRNIDRPGMKFVTIFCDDQKVCCGLQGGHHTLVIVIVIAISCLQYLITDLPLLHARHCVRCPFLLQ